MLLPVRRFDWLLPPSNCEPHKRTPPRQVCFDGHVRFAGRRASHWAGACGGDRGSSLSVSTRSPSLYHSTVGVGRPSPCSLGWLAHPWRQSDRRGVLRSEVENLPAVDGILVKQRKRKTCQVQPYIYVTNQLALVLARVSNPVPVGPKSYRV